MIPLKIKFTDFWPGFDLVNNYFTQLLSKRYEIEVVKTNPDILFFSVFGFEHLRYRCLKIFYTAENVRPNFKECDFSFSFDYDSYGNRNFRFPNYIRVINLKELTHNKNPQKIISEKRKFCCMLVSNPNCEKRNQFFEELSKYKQVDSGGSHLNNIGYRVEDRLEFTRQYKFTISFENSSYPGYTTEKVFFPMLVDSIPIYWGNPLIHEELNAKSIINVHSFDNIDKVINKIIELDKNDELYENMLSQPTFKGNTIPISLQDKYILEKLTFCINSINRISPISKKNQLKNALRYYKNKLYWKLK